MSITSWEIEKKAGTLHGYLRKLRQHDMLAVLKADTTAFSMVLSTEVDEHQTSWIFPFSSEEEEWEKVLEEVLSYLDGVERSLLRKKVEGSVRFFNEEADC